MIGSELIEWDKVIKTIHNYWKKQLDTLPCLDIRSVDAILEYNKSLCRHIEAIPPVCLVGERAKTKEIKYFDEDEKVWKIGSVIVNETD